jgi:lactate racemase
VGVLCGNLGRDRVTYLDRPYRPVLSMMPTKYEDIWTAAKGFYKLEPIVADGGELNHLRAVYHAALGHASHHHQDRLLQPGLLPRPVGQVP